MTSQKMIAALDLAKLPEEGGFFKEVYRSKEMVGKTALATDIYYLITPEEFSGLHRVRSSIEIFNFYAGDPAKMIQIDAEGTLTEHLLGPDIMAGQSPKVIVPAGVWQGTRLVEGGRWALLGCTCIPGFEFSDFEGGTQQSFLEKFPAHARQIKQFVKP